MSGTPDGAPGVGDSRKGSHHDGPACRIHCACKEACGGYIFPQFHPMASAPKPINTGWSRCYWRSCQVNMSCYYTQKSDDSTNAFVFFFFGKKVLFVFKHIRYHILYIYLYWTLRRYILTYSYELCSIFLSLLLENQTVHAEERGRCVVAQRQWVGTWPCIFNRHHWETEQFELSCKANVRLLLTW